MTTGLKIGQLAKRASCQIETIRYYEREGLLHAPERTDGNYRLYQDAHVERLQFIRRCRSLDMTLEEIRALLKFRDASTGDCRAVNALLDEHIGHVASRIGELQKLERQLKSLRDLCASARSTRDCKILHELAGSAGTAASVHAGHVQGAHARDKRPLKTDRQYRGSRRDASG